MKDNAPHNALRAAVNRAIAAGSPVFVNQPAPSSPINRYQVWSADHAMEYIESESSFKARRQFAAAHDLDVTDVMARRV